MNNQKFKVGDLVFYTTSPTGPGGCIYEVCIQIAGEITGVTLSDRGIYYTVLTDEGEVQRHQRLLRLFNGWDYDLQPDDDDDL